MEYFDRIQELKFEESSSGDASSSKVFFRIPKEMLAMLSLHNGIKLNVVHESLNISGNKGNGPLRPRNEVLLSSIDPERSKHIWRFRIHLEKVPPPNGVDPSFMPRHRGYITELEHFFGERNIRVIMLRGSTVNNGDSVKIDALIDCTDYDYAVKVTVRRDGNVKDITDSSKISDLTEDESEIIVSKIWGLDFGIGGVFSSEISDYFAELCIKVKDKYAIQNYHIEDSVLYSKLMSNHASRSVVGSVELKKDVVEIDYKIFDPIIKGYESLFPERTFGVDSLRAAVATSIESMVMKLIVFFRDVGYIHIRVDFPRKFDVNDDGIEYSNMIQLVRDQGFAIEQSFIRTKDGDHQYRIDMLLRYKNIKKDPQTDKTLQESLKSHFLETYSSLSSDNIVFPESKKFDS